MGEIDWSECSIVERDPEKMGGVPTIRAWRLSADSVVDNYEDGLAECEIAEIFGVPVEDVCAILAYAYQARQIEYSV